MTTKKKNQNNIETSGATTTNGRRMRFGKFLKKKKKRKNGIETYSSSQGQMSLILPAGWLLPAESDADAAVEVDSFRRL